MVGTIYIHINRTDGKCYVGQSKNLIKRWHPKLHAYRNNPHLYRALKKYGWEGFDHLIVFQQECTQEELNSLERLWIVTLNTRVSCFGYNLRAGGHRGEFSKETRTKMSKSHKSLVGKLNSFYGKKHTKETSQTIREWHLANGSKLWTPERRKRHSKRMQEVRSQKFWSSRKVA
jgi:group I intron endonuclease